MFKTLTTSLLCGLLSVNCFGYDIQKAKDYEKFYAGFTHEACANSKLFINALDVMALIRAKGDYILLDVRTNGEVGVMALQDKNALHIELEHLFKVENLDKLPTDKQIIAVCHSGTRGTIAAIGLKQLGFKNVQVLKGGLVALADANTPANAPIVK